MTLLQDIRRAQINAGEQACIDGLVRSGLIQAETGMPVPQSTLRDNIRHRQMLAGEDVVVKHLEQTLDKLKKDRTKSHLSLVPKA